MDASTGPPPKRFATAALAASVASIDLEASSVSISLRTGVPWQNAIDTTDASLARLRSATLSMQGALANPALFRSRRMAATS